VQNDNLKKGKRPAEKAPYFRQKLPEPGAVSMRQRGKTADGEGRKGRGIVCMLSGQERSEKKVHQRLKWLPTGTRCFKDAAKQMTLDYSASGEGEAAC